MARYEFKLPDIGEGIAEAEIVAWHVKVGDTVEEDQQLADMMTDKATVEMESPVAGKVIELAGEVGDQIAIGSVLVEIETEGAPGAPEPVARQQDERRSPTARSSRPRSRPKKFRPRDGEAPAAAGKFARACRRAALLRREKKKPSTSRSTERPAGGTRPKPRLPRRPPARARPRHRPREVKTARPRPPLRPRRLSALQRRQRLRPRRRAPRADETIKVVGLRRKIAENMQEAKRRIPHFTWSRNSTSPRSRTRAR
jgi:2-oxoisovalerate dehydrogenase E2 component (dihydrolipoyl transacylase)